MIGLLVVFGIAAVGVIFVGIIFVHDPWRWDNFAQSDARPAPPPAPRATLASQAQPKELESRP